MADGGRVDGPVAVRQLSVLDRVVADRGEAVAARLPRQDDFAGLDLLLRDHGAAGGLRSGCGTQHTQKLSSRSSRCASLLKMLK